MAHPGPRLNDTGLKDPDKAQTAEAFANWGISTAELLQNVVRISQDWLIFASGGLHNGIEIAKCLALGASLGGMAGNFIKAANDLPERVVQVMRMIVDQTRIAMFASGAARLSELTPNKLIHIP